MSGGVSSRLLASTLYDLSGSAAGASQICTDETCLKGLANLLAADPEQESERETVELALKAVQRLCSQESNRERLVGQPGFVVRVTQLTACIHIEQLAQKALESLVNTHTPAGSISNSVSTPFATPIKPFSVPIGLLRPRGTAAAAGVTAPSASGPTSSSASLGVRYLFTIPVSVSGIASAAERDELEKFLLSYRGLISVNLQRTGVCTLYSKQSAAELMPALIEAVKGKFSKLQVNWKQNEEENNKEKENQQNNTNSQRSRLSIAPKSAAPTPAPSQPTAAASSESDSSAASAYFYSRALTVHASATESANLSAKFAARQKNSRTQKNEENQQSSTVKTLFSSVSSFFW